MEDFIIKEEKKKKAHRKRDKFWKLIFPHSNKSKKNSTKDDKVKRTSEQTEKINSLATYASTHFSVSLEHELFENILESNQWEYKKALSDLADYEEASHGILIEPPKDTQKLLGSENDGGTSCYIDALLFAMYIFNTTFDPLLTYDISPEHEEKIKLQTVLRLFVNKLRKGHLVHADYVHWFRKVLQDASWHGQDYLGNWSQEDASELFMFITEMFELPYLPFQIRLFHGANKDTDDDRVMTDRALALSIPDDVGNIQLQDILLDYFYNSVITGVRRNIDFNNISESVIMSPVMDKEKDTPKKLPLPQQPEGQEDITVTAWQVLELLPFYSATNEQGDSIKTQLDSSFPDTHMILPIVLKRYRYDSLGGSTKIKKHVEIPVTIDFNKFVNQNVDDPMCPTCGHLINWTLHFRSAVCHKGDSPCSGHYISYARADVDEPYWLKFDDLNSESRVTVIQDKNAGSIFTDLAENAYMIFYELDKTCRHELSIDEIERKDVDSKSITSISTYETDTEEQDCHCKDSKQKRKHRTHHHHLNHHLSES
ncbi:hypothetical protein INT48_007300, partial [Thamnidium elegans]